MTYSHDSETLLRQVANLHMRVSISKTRGLIQRSQQLTARYMTRSNTKNRPVLNAELFHRISLRPDGQPFSGSAEDIEAAELAEPTTVSLGALTLRVVDAGPRALAASLGALEEGVPGGACWLVEYEAGAQTPCIGQCVVVPTGVAGVSLTFVVWLSHADLHNDEGPDLGPGAERNPALDGIGPNQALLVLEPAGDTE